MATYDSTTHCIYRIVCFATGEVYVGQSENPKIRKSAHFCSLRKNQHYNAKMQSAYNEFGAGQFYFEVIENNIPSEDINNREAWWINYYDSLSNGFNAKKGGTGRTTLGVSCSWNGVVYDSIKQAASANGVTIYCMSTRLRLGYLCDDDMPLTSRKPCEWNGIKYKSIREAAKAVGVEIGCMERRLQKGYTSDTEMTRTGKKLSPPFLWDGVEYQTVSDAARANGINPSTMWAFISKGKTSSSQVSKPLGDKCTWNGIEYASLNEASKLVGIPRTTLKRMIDRGYTCDDDVRRGRA